jgi:hypothetical protein
LKPSKVRAITQRMRQKYYAPQTFSNILISLSKTVWGNVLISEVGATSIPFKRVIYFPNVFSFNSQKKCKLEMGKSSEHTK